LSRRDLQRVRVFVPPVLSLTGIGQARLSSTGYALGLGVTTDLHRGTVISHSGGLPGFWLCMAWHPESGHGTVVLTNGNRGNPSTLCVEALGRVLNHHQAPAATAALWPETVELREQADALVRHWDDDLAARIFAENVDFDRPLPQRREELARLVAEIGPLSDSRPSTVVSATTAADITWSIPGERGELLCMIHLTPVEPARIQQFTVKAVPAGRPRSAGSSNLSLQHFGDAYLTPAANVRMRFPE
jgi:hypothetical protein